jgi:hypothetical protein
VSRELAQDSFNSTRAHWGIIVAIVLVPVLVYSQIWNHQFVYDSLGYVWENPYIRDFSWSNTRWLLLNNYRESWQPVTWLSHTIDFTFFGNWAGGHHLVNLFFHIVDCLLLYRLLTYLTTDTGPNSNQSNLVAGLSTLIFAIHPLHVESVAMVYERRDMLYCFFMFLSTGMYLAYRDKHDHFRWYYYLGSLVLFSVTLMTKPMAVTFPVLLMLLDLYRSKRDLSWQLLKETTLDKFPYFALMLPVLVITVVTQGTAILSWETFPFEYRVLNVLHNISFFSYKFLLPTFLSPYYPLTPLQDMLNVGFWLPGALITIIITSLAIVFWRKGDRGLMILWLFFLVSYSPVSGIIHTGGAARADHFIYLSLISHCILLAWLINRVLSLAVIIRTASIAVASVFLIMLTSISFAYVSQWRTPISLWSYTLSIYPEVIVPRKNLALNFILIGEFDRANDHIKLLPSPIKEEVSDIMQLEKSTRLKASPTSELEIQDENNL